MIGRKEEIRQLNRLYEDKRAELVAVYGRRRVGKTYLIDETFEGKFTFRHAGLSPIEAEAKGDMREQLQHFYDSLTMTGMQQQKAPESWMEAFLLLEKFLQDRDDGSRQLVFLDEMPWMDTPRSGFLRAFEGFWNNWGCHRKNLMVIVCGSANSWIQNKLINNHGGLYNRITWEIKLSPFSLKECEEFYEENNVRFSRYDIVQSYMILGGIPYYMNYVDGRFSLTQNIDKLFFGKHAILANEYQRLFFSLFTNPESVKALVQLLYTRSAGYTRKEIVEKLGISDGSGLTRNLNALIASDFIIKYVPFGCSKREPHYKLVDAFCLFYLHFLNQTEREAKFWEHNLNAQAVVVWRGFAFENVCFNHIEEIKHALGISGVATTSSAWAKREDEGTQIDLLISRQDNVINMCEIKYYSRDFTVDKQYYRTLLARQSILSEMVSPKLVVRSTLITTFGLSRNEYSGVFSNVITLEDLFSGNSEI